MFPNLYYNWEVFYTRCYFHKLKTIKCLSMNWSRRLNEEFLKQIIWRVAYAKRKPICSRLYTVRIVKLQSSITIWVTCLEATWGWNIASCGCRPLRKKCPCSELFWSTFSRIRTEYNGKQCNEIVIVEGGLGSSENGDDS